MTPCRLNESKQELCEYCWLLKLYMKHVALQKTVNIKKGESTFYPLYIMKLH